MAFFGQQLGYQDPIREHVANPGITPQHVFQSGLYRQSPYKEYLDLSKPYPPAPEGGKPEPSKACKEETAVPEKPLYTAGYAGDDVSNEDLQDRIQHHKYKHEPTVVYRRPLTTSADYGDWLRDAPLKEKEPWTQVPHYVLISSEMTRFVDKMGQTNKEFSLY